MILKPHHQANIFLKKETQNRKGKEKEKNHKTKRKTRTFSLKNINKILKINPHLNEVFAREGKLGSLKKMRRQKSSLSAMTTSAKKEKRKEGRFSL